MFDFGNQKNSTNLNVGFLLRKVFQFNTFLKLFTNVIKPIINLAKVLLPRRLSVGFHMDTK